MLKIMFTDTVWCYNSDLSFREKQVIRTICRLFAVKSLLTLGAYFEVFSEPQFCSNIKEPRFF